MKNLLTGLFLSAILLFSASCAKEQSELSLSSLSEYATITGTIDCLKGASLISDGVVATNLPEPAAGRTVMVTVANDSYVSGTDGFQVYETQTDENGSYTLQVPMAYNVQTMSVTVSVVPFYDTRSYSIAGTSDIVTVDNAYYDRFYDRYTSATTMVTSQSMNVTKGRVHQKDLAMTSNDVMPQEFTEEVTVIGRITARGWVENPYGTATPNSTDYWRAGVVPVADKEVRLRINISSQSTGGWGAVYIYSYPTTDDDGYYKHTFRLPSHIWTVNTNCQATIERDLVEDFTHRYCYEITSADGGGNLTTTYAWGSQIIDQVVINSASTPSGNTAYNLTSRHHIAPLDMGTLRTSYSLLNSNNSIYGVNVWTTADGWNIPSAYNNLLNW